ncbi:flavin reductase family protein [Fulvivirga sp. M361]|uniref:flavin reductase family protein n=1 Tax=Fulvivirga sp. M361 TaxID=2594266 RepID=UPI00117B0B6B|nr:flavin reductase family protein [Fulvivirga sp. M361]TRX54287.1 flavin reductase family protein [Fulvivirga sp. M361]
MTIDPKEVSLGKLHAYLLGAIVPRPIAFASTIDSEDNVNLSPFSYFNVFSANPPILIFSPARRGRDNTSKHSYDNVLEVPEVVINMVNYPMVEQMSLASTEYPRGVNEFIKSGLTPVPSERVKPPRVKESPASFECKVIEVKRLGKEGGAGNLVICEVILVHLEDNMLTNDGLVDPFKLDAVARMGGNWYSKISRDVIFEITKPLTTLGIGVDGMPEAIRNSTILTGNNLGRLGNVEALPSRKEVENYNTTHKLSGRSSDELHRKAQEVLEKGDVSEAWLILLQNVEKW